MKKILISLTILTVVLIGVSVYAQGPFKTSDGFVPCAGYHKMGYGYHGHMMRGADSGYDQKFMDETAGLRKELHLKKFEYSEALRNPKTDPETISKLEKEIQELKSKIHSQAPQGMRKGFNKACWRL